MSHPVGHFRADNWTRSLCSGTSCYSGVISPVPLLLSFDCFGPYLLFTGRRYILQLKCFVSNCSSSQLISTQYDKRNMTMANSVAQNRVIGKRIWRDFAWLRPHIPFPTLTLDINGECTLCDYCLRAFSP